MHYEFSRTFTDAQVKDNEDEYRQMDVTTFRQIANAFLLALIAIAMASVATYLIFFGMANILVALLS